MPTQDPLEPRFDLLPLNHLDLEWIGDALNDSALRWLLHAGGHPSFSARLHQTVEPVDQG
jgi:hypothetical protein